MCEKNIYTLKINKDYKKLIPPLQQREYLQLEASLLTNGCLEPIAIYKGFIIDGHNRYEICTRHRIPFAVQEMEFECREAVISWICAKQLERLDITEETRRFLIGMQYESEVFVNTRRKTCGVDQEKYETKREIYASSAYRVALRIAEENHISPSTVQRYAVYTRALESIGQKEPSLVPRILTGKYKFTCKNVVELSQMAPDEIKKVARKIERNQKSFARNNKTRCIIQKSSNQDADILVPPIPSVKDMPIFDPDAEITGLMLTIPSWASSIDRTRTKADLSIVSGSARSKLAEALRELQGKVSELLDAIKED